MPQIILVIWQILKSLPQLYQLFKQLKEMNADLSKGRKESENAKVRENAENAQSPEEKQAAVDGAASRFGN